METELLSEVPANLQRLLRLIVRGFYSMEHAILIDMLVRNPCVKEDDMIEMLKFERKQLRSLINTLKNDKFIKARMRMETDAEGRTTRHNYYFINYSVFVNVVKYKLDHMRKKIEMEERDNTSRASFKCPQCHKTYTDLEAGQLLDFMTQTLRCTFCQTEVEEDESSMPKQDARTMLANFNDQIQPIYELLRECEDVKLAPEVLEPEPVDLKKPRDRPHASGSQMKHGGLDGDSIWSGAATRDVNFGPSSSQMTITFDKSNEVKDAATKDTPIWMKQSTVAGVTSYDNTELDMGGPSDTAKTVRENVSGTVDQDDIMRTLLVHEPKAVSVPIPGAPTSETSGSASEDDNPSRQMFTGEDIGEMESDEDDDAGAMVTIGGQRVSFHDVTDEMVAKMNPLEKEEYIRVGQEIYQNMYE